MNCLASPVALLLTLCSATAAAQTDPWAPIQRLVGEWSGTSSGQPGEGTVLRRYAFVLNDRYLHETNTSEYPPQERNKKGERYEHWGLVSYLGADWKARETYQFVSDDEFVETFELAPPGKPYQPYSRALLKRVRR